MPSPKDRIAIAPPGALLERSGIFPLPPLNVQVNSSYQKQSFDIQWTSPSLLQPNSKYEIVGVNIYRAFNQNGPWIRLNNEPVGSYYWRDNTQIKISLNEDVSRQFTARGFANDAAGKYFFRTLNRPIYIGPAMNDPNCTNTNVFVTVNGIPSFVEAIYSADGIVELRHLPTYDVIGKQQINPVLPTSDNDVVLATYKYISNEVRSNLDQRVFYRVTTVALENGSLIETPLKEATTSNRSEIEKLDYIWTEAIRRSKWILDQGGERVKVFLKKSAGIKCGCINIERKQPESTCTLCYGTGYIGGYDGPYDLIVAPDNGPRKSTQSNRGRSIDHSYDSWAPNEPLLSQRDIIVKKNGDRYAIGAVTSPSNRGMQLLQFFTLSHLDENDIKYKIPVFDTGTLIAPQGRFITMYDKDSIPDSREILGKTRTYSNIEY